MDLTSGIFGKVFQYLDGKISLEDIEDWLVPHLYEFLTLPPCSASELAGVVELGLAELSIGQHSEHDFRAMLQEYIREHDTITIDMRPPEPVCTGTSTDTTPIMFSAMSSEIRVSFENI